MKKEKYNITGMTCSSCSNHVEKAVSKLKGIKEVDVNLLSNSMSVIYNDNVVNSQLIINAVKSAGYDASLIEKNNYINKMVNTDKQLKIMKRRLIISFIFWIPLMCIAMGNMFWMNSNIRLISLIQLVLLIPIIYENRNYFFVGFKRLFKLEPNMDSLIAIGSTASIIYGIYSIFMINIGFINNQQDLVERFKHEIYFESAGTILTLITLGKYLETKSKGKTTDAINKLINLTPKMATVIRNNKEYKLYVEDIVVNDIVLIKPGEIIPVDGTIIEGESMIDQSSITGESIPVEKNINDNVISGTINKNGVLKIKALKVGDDTTLAQIIKLVEEASNSKAPISKIADRVSGIFVPLVIIISILSFIIWIISGQSFEFALTMGISVLVISCPCALGLATPVAIMVGTGKGAENGILIKSAESLELLHSVGTVILDKTGTITEGKPKIIDIVTDMEVMDFLKIAGSLESQSEHPLALAIMEKVKEYDINLLEAKEVFAISGRGIKGKIKENDYIVGNEKFMIENGINLSIIKTKIQDNINTVIYFAENKNIIGCVTIADPVKKESKVAINEFNKKKIDVLMVTGDNNEVANDIGKKIGIKNIIAEVLPQEKEEAVVKIQKAGNKVAFVGDGINDSPALTKADVGIAIGSGTDIAIDSADIVLIKNSLLDVNTAMDLSRAVIKNIKINLFWAFFYNIIGIPIAAGVFYNSLGIKLNPMLGALAMSMSSVCVVTNALRLRKFKAKKIFIDGINENEQECSLDYTNCSLEVSNEKSDNKCNYKEEKNMNTKIIQIEGMACNHCTARVEKALKEIEGIKKVEVSLENKNAIIEIEKEISNEKIKNIIEEAGYKVTDIK